MNLVNEGVLPPNELDDRDERREEREVAQERETVTDIVADIRERAYNATRHGERTTDNYAVSELLKSIADRIAAAWEREAIAIATEHAVLPAVCITKPSGNAAAMREALENSNGLLEELAAIGEWGESAREQIAENNAALATPARNCDLYKNKKDAEAAFISEECKHPCGNCTVNDEYGCALVHECGVDWLFATAERKGEGDENK